jgi:hypothetical protein
LDFLNYCLIGAYVDDQLNWFTGGIFGQASEIKGVERNGKQIDVILENEKRLPVYDIETSNGMETD